MPLCGRSKDPTRVRSPRQLPTDHDYAARPANIRLINRRDSFLDRYPRRLRYRKKEKPALVVDWSFHIRGTKGTQNVTLTSATKRGSHKTKMIPQGRLQTQCVPVSFPTSGNRLSGIICQRHSLAG